MALCIAHSDGCMELSWLTKSLDKVFRWMLKSTLIPSSTLHSLPSAQLHPSNASSTIVLKDSHPPYPPPLLSREHNTHNHQNATQWPPLMTRTIHKNNIPIQKPPQTKLLKDLNHCFNRPRFETITQTPNSTPIHDVSDTMQITESCDPPYPIG